jgi:transcriptional regulator with XRE-family HTH domain
LVTQPKKLSDAERQRVGHRLRLLRLEQHLKQRAVAKRAGVALGTVRLIELGDGRDVRPENIEKVARALGKTLEELRQATLEERTAYLNAEDLEFAQQFHHAVLDVKLAVRTLLSTPLRESTRRTIGQIMHGLATMHDDTLLEMALLVVMRATTAATVGKVLPSTPAPAAPVELPVRRRRTR